MNNKEIELEIHTLRILLQAFLDIDPVVLRGIME